MKLNFSNARPPHPRIVTRPPAGPKISQTPGVEPGAFYPAVVVFIALVLACVVVVVATIVGQG